MTSLVNGIFIEPVEAVREGKRVPGSIVILLLVFILDDDNATLNGTPQSGLPTMSAEEERGVVRVKVKVRNCGDRAAGRNPNHTHTHSGMETQQHSAFHVVQPGQQTVSGCMSASIVELFISHSLHVHRFTSLASQLFTHRDRIIIIRLQKMCNKLVLIHI